jgi:hypothetical protein
MAVNDIADDELLRRAVAAQQRGSGRGKVPLWAKVSATFSLGSTYSAQLCRRFGFDPNKQVKS